MPVYPSYFADVFLCDGVPEERGIFSCGPEKCFVCPFFDGGQANFKIESGPNFTTEGHSLTHTHTRMHARTHTRAKTVWTSMSIFPFSRGDLNLLSRVCLPFAPWVPRLKETAEWVQRRAPQISWLLEVSQRLVSVRANAAVLPRLKKAQLDLWQGGGVGTFPNNHSPSVQCFSRSLDKTDRRDIGFIGFVLDLDFFKRQRVCVFLIALCLVLLCL